MARPKMVVRTFIPREKLLHPARLGQSFKLIIATRQKFVGIGLVPYIPNQPILFEVKKFKESDGDFDTPREEAR